ncbi:CDGSH iron-sulfur domain-containing protein [Nocardia sp. NPDC006044]|uniref:CDGSH iron-sulfur domain-containing protein n=1 Tax=Nocardia sp. NPDC006044 TaxID=3364306 RepID=UPI0036890BE0
MTTHETDVRAGVATLHARAAQLYAECTTATDARRASFAHGVANSVLAPLNRLLGDAATDARVDSIPTPVAAAAVWALAETATRLFVEDGATDLAEAAAALQDLACRWEEPPDAAAIEENLAALAALTGDRAGFIRTAKNGPYVVLNPTELSDGLGCRLAVRPLLTLCRCGASQRKPYCDGSHLDSGFTDEVSPDRVPDRRDSYVGQQVTIHDNRGICQHSGFCTDRLGSVFRAGTEPFVAPSGGRMDEIVRAVRDCPSGALSFSMDGVEARETVDHHDCRPQTITVTADGPYRVTGGIPLQDPTGSDLTRAQGASREHYALCRCGRSQNKPFCSGMHYYVQFTDPVLPDGETPSMFHWAGGFPALTRMTRLFYEKYVPEDPLLSRVFSNMSPDHPERVAAWLGEVFGGPERYSSGYGGYQRMLSEHKGKRLSEEMRARWVELLLRAARDAGLPNDPEFRSAFQSYIEWGSRLAVENSQSESRPPANMPMPHWDWNTAAGPPGIRISALATEEEPAPEVELPGPEETVRFDTHIKPLFRPRDRNSMVFAFDLWSIDDVRSHAEAILDQVRRGAMPCDGPWPAPWVALFERWIETGTAE